MDNPLDAHNLSDDSKENDVVPVNRGTGIRPNVISQAKGKRMAANAFNLGNKFIYESLGTDWIILCNVRSDNSQIVLDPRREFELHP
jgi:hypothetical protein